jgi:hypothetical protein
LRDLLKGKRKPEKKGSIKNLLTLRRDLKSFLGLF